MTRRKRERPAVRSCDWCECEYSPQNYRQRFCSQACATLHGNAQKPHPCGPCETCGRPFHSRTPGKRFCSLDCYLGSDFFAALTWDNMRRLNPTMGVPRVCRQCGEEYSRKRKAAFCGALCRRQYFAARFDRWIANPETIALPQNFDEFLDRDVLSCPVAGCDWEGENLSAHANFAHGIPAREFKKLCGFNLKTGLVGRETSKAMTDRNHRMLADGVIQPGFPADAPRSGPKTDYLSLEGKEHRKKAAACRERQPPPPRPPQLCRGCGVDVPQPVCGRQLYCTTQCRDRHYATRRVAEAVCAYCGGRFEANGQQARRTRQSLPVCCSLECRNKFNAVKALAARGQREWRAERKDGAS